jgi:hypothetical protein
MQFIKKLHVQLSLIVLFFFLYLSLIGDQTILLFFIVLLLSALYVIFHKKKDEVVIALRVLLYLFLAYEIYYILSTFFTEIHLIKLFQPNITTLELLHRVYFSYFLDLLYIIIISAVLIFNKPAVAIKEFIRSIKSA